jgi:hypothetical protein
MGKKYSAQTAVENYAHLRVSFKKIFENQEVEKEFFEKADEKFNDLLLYKSREIVEIIAYSKNQNPEEYEIDIADIYSDFLNAYMMYKGVKKDFLSEVMKKNLSSGNATENTEETETT